LCYFSVGPLSMLLEQMDLEVFNVVRVPTKGGSIRLLVQRSHGPHPVNPSVLQLISLEKELGFCRGGPYLAFAERIENSKRQLTRLLMDLKQEGKTIAGYGASVGSSTLLHVLEIGKLVEFLVDDNVIKHNRFSPGHHIQVFPSQSVCRADYAVILAWRYSHGIVARHERFRRNGGRFIVPFPVVEILE
jgi:hypothetical protein